MKNKNKYKVGDKIVELGRIFKIFQIKKVKGSSGETEKIVFFKPYRSDNNLAGLICSIPLKNIERN